MTFEGLFFYITSIFCLDYEQCTYRAYNKLTAQIKPDMAALNKQKEELYVYY
jgi:hypothetical protein